MAGKFEPKVPVQLNPPKDDPISLADLAKADGECPSKLPNAESWSSTAYIQLPDSTRLSHNLDTA